MKRELRELIVLIFEGYLVRKNEHRLYDRDSAIPEQIISMYYQANEEPPFKILYNNFKRKYLYNESRIDETLSDEELEGLDRVYDYIRGYDFSKQKFDVFVEGLRIHALLYSACPYPEFGGQLRDNTAVLKDEIVEVPPASEAKKYFQSFIGYKLPEVDFADPASIFSYINACIYITTELIRNQPFADGNKRTFRALLNLMFKQHNLPPVYVKTKEREEYKDALMKAMKKRDYTSLNQFYYYKICDSIYDLDIAEELKKEDEKVYSKKKNNN